MADRHGRNPQRVYRGTVLSGSLEVERRVLRMLAIYGK
jgi:hypothetical protein